MGLQDKVMEAMKAAMKSKDTQSLEALRSVKSALLLAQTETGSKQEISEEEGIKILQKQVKQRKDSAAIYKEQGREDLAEPELLQAKVIEQFLPKQLSVEEVSKIVDEIITETGASSMADMGKVMGIASGKLAGKADGKTISTVVKSRLS
ncbi:GatB/YqeY domain-containing protein [Aequorivita xiaoshiensis]|uniref:GatB/YqeY domain-containing protein n=1 Tax=Aequorivita xiaoshiensis TaxID=2874476 RepID=A0A9X1R4Y0_9FLAO|nr:GatB/YqeY domain-containing protein [Aequorivita xiaoshiensis]MCG2432017.1 GatB/YqeY domain-containing protein [Aequorivita xiaoshiensis]